MPEAEATSTVLENMGWNRSMAGPAVKGSMANMRAVIRTSYTCAPPALVSQ